MFVPMKMKNFTSAKELFDRLSISLQPTDVNGSKGAPWLFAGPRPVLAASIYTFEPLAQIRDVERFFHDAGDLHFSVFILFDGTRVSGQDDDFPGEASLPEKPDQVEAGQTEHMVIGNDEIERARGAVEYFQGLVAVLCEKGMMSRKLEDNIERLPGTGFIVNNQDIQRLCDCGLVIHQVSKRAYFVPASPGSRQSAPKWRFYRMGGTFIFEAGRMPFNPSHL